MIARISIGLLLLAAGAGYASAAGKVVKEEKGRCQAVVPDDAVLALPYMAQGPSRSYTVTVDHDGEPYKVLSTAELQQFHYSRAIESSSSRLIVEKSSQAVSAGFRAIHVYLPTKDGRCHIGISFRDTVPEDVAMEIAKSSTLIKPAAKN